MFLRSTPEAGTDGGSDAAEQPLYPSSRAFVVQLTRDLASESLAGRVEHVSSGRSRRFGSHDDLVEFMREVLGDRGPDQAGTSPRGKGVAG